MGAGQGYDNYGGCGCGESDCLCDGEVLATTICEVAVDPEDPDKELSPYYVWDISEYIDKFPKRPLIAGSCQTATGDTAENRRLPGLSPIYWRILQGAKVVAEGEVMGWMKDVEHDISDEEELVVIGFLPLNENSVVVWYEGPPWIRVYNLDLDWSFVTLADPEVDAPPGNIESVLIEKDRLICTVIGRPKIIAYHFKEAGLVRMDFDRPIDRGHYGAILRSTEEGLLLNSPESGNIFRWSDADDCFVPFPLDLGEKLRLCPVYAPTLSTRTSQTTTYSKPAMLSPDGRWRLGEYFPYNASSSSSPDSYLGWQERDENNQWSPVAPADNLRTFFETRNTNIYIDLWIDGKLVIPRCTGSSTTVQDSLNVMEPGETVETPLFGVYLDGTIPTLNIKYVDYADWEDAETFLIATYDSLTSGKQFLFLYTDTVYPLRQIPLEEYGDLVEVSEDTQGNPVYTWLPRQSSRRTAWGKLFKLFIEGEGDAEDEERLCLMLADGTSGASLYYRTEIVPKVDPGEEEEEENEEEEEEPKKYRWTYWKTLVLPGRPWVYDASGYYMPIIRVVPLTFGKYAGGVVVAFRREYEQSYAFSGILDPDGNWHELSVIPCPLVGNDRYRVSVSLCAHGPAVWLAVATFATASETNADEESTVAARLVYDPETESYDWERKKGLRFPHDSTALVATVQNPLGPSPYLFLRSHGQLIQFGTNNTIRPAIRTTDIFKSFKSFIMDPDEEIVPQVDVPLDVVSFDDISCMIPFIQAGYNTENAALRLLLGTKNGVNGGFCVGDISHIIKSGGIVPYRSFITNTNNGGGIEIDLDPTEEIPDEYLGRLFFTARCASLDPVDVTEIRPNFYWGFLNVLNSGGGTVTPVHFGRFWLRDGAAFRPAFRTYNVKRIRDGFTADPIDRSVFRTPYRDGRPSHQINTSYRNPPQPLSDVSYDTHFDGPILTGAPCWDRTFSPLGVLSPEPTEAVLDVDFHYRPLTTALTLSTVPDSYDQTTALVTASGLKIYTLNAVDEAEMRGEYYQDLDIMDPIDPIREERFHEEPAVEDAEKIIKVRCCKYNPMFPYTTAGAAGMNGIFGLSDEGRLIRYILTPETGIGHKMPKIVKMIANNHPARLEYGCFARCNTTNSFPELDEADKPFRAVVPVRSFEKNWTDLGTRYIADYVRACVPEQPEDMNFRYGIFSAVEKKWKFIDWKTYDESEKVVNKWGNPLYAEDDMVYFGELDHFEDVWNSEEGKYIRWYYYNISGGMPLERPDEFEAIQYAEVYQNGLPNKEWPGGDLGPQPRIRRYNDMNWELVVFPYADSSNCQFIVTGQTLIGMVPGKTSGTSVPTAIAYFSNGDILYFNLTTW